jgi:transcriptional regulator with XRE-family HTH domain
VADLDLRARDEEPMSRVEDFEKVQQLKAEGLTDRQIAKKLGISVEHLRQFMTEVRGPGIAADLDSLEKQ